MNKLMEQTAKPIAQSLKQYIKTSSRTMVTLEPELAFFVGAARMVETLRGRGLPISKPDVLPMARRAAHITDLHNVQLALMSDDDTETIASDVQFDDTGRVGVLTGPNSGGKTTYLRSVGMAQVMFQAGLFIPAARAQISPVQEILTHFPRLETRQQGRLEEEAERLRTLFERITPGSLVLLNETFSSTAFGEALYLAQDILSAMCAVGVRALFATHLVELVEQSEDIEGAVAVQSRLCSLVAGIQLDEHGSPRPTYRVTRGEPLGRSYAREIARKYGISLEQILAAQDGEG
jgi:DNA mismatch repair ATPase MutS